MRKILLLLLSLVLIFGSLAFSTSNNTATASTSTVVPLEDGLHMITDTEEKSEYIMTIDGVQTRYIETIKTIDEKAKDIHTKVYNEETNELLQDFTTTLVNDEIADQEVDLLKSLPERNVVDKSNGESYPTLQNKNMIALASSSVKSNKSLVGVLGINYTKNFNTGRGTANYAGLITRYASLSSSSTFDTHASAVDSMRGVETGTLAGWLISGFSGGGLVGGKIISWATAKIILKNIAGPLAIASNAWALGQWFYYYNRIANNYTKI
ncbi:hypothetical protein ACIGEL_04450 [Rossellomorea aquimaris]|uniref:hypothetical protein n=1 Tax=Rossellomorea aquimaris TaxID=189382 RepID=UPI0037CA41FA